MEYGGRYYQFLAMDSPIGVALQLEVWPDVSQVFQLHWLLLLRAPGNLFRGYHIDRQQGLVYLLVVLNQGPNANYRFAAIQPISLPNLARFVR